MRSVTVHPYALVPVPAGLVTHVKSSLIRGTHAFLTSADRGQFSKGETKQPRKSSGPANFSKLKSAKFNHFNAAICANAACIPPRATTISWNFHRAQSPNILNINRYPHLLSYFSSIYSWLLSSFSKEKKGGRSLLNMASCIFRRGRGDIDKNLLFGKTMRTFTVPAMSPRPRPCPHKSPPKRSRRKVWLEAKNS